MGIYDLTICPHYDEEVNRQDSLKESLRKSKKVAIALENCTALEIIDNTYRLIASKDNKRAYKVYWKSGKYHMEPLKPSKDFSPLSQIVGA